MQKRLLATLPKMRFLNAILLKILLVTICY